MGIKSICVLGLGYIGLPTASLFAAGGYGVIGVDKDERVVNMINRGLIHIEEPGLNTLVRAAVNSGQLVAKHSPEAADAFIIAVPTPLTEDKKADLSFVKNAAESILPYLRAGNLVILESTSPPLTTQDFLVPILAQSGLVPGEEVLVAHCPERVLPGNILQELVNNNRIIGGINPASALKAREVYKRIVQGDIVLTDAASAEMAKLMENTFRDVNIALVNELCLVAAEMELDALEVIRLANMHPRVSLHRPGPGVGGHCLSVDPWFIVEKSRQARLIRLAREVNDSMPYYVVERIRELVGDIAEPVVTILGVSYKGNVDDTRESPSTSICRLLQESGVKIRIYDPHVRNYEVEQSDFETACLGSDLIVVAADHQEFKYLAPAEIGVLMRHKRVFDTRNCLNTKKWEEAGFFAQVLGRKFK